MVLIIRALTGMLLFSLGLYAAPVVWLGLSYVEEQTERGVILVVKGVHPGSGAFKAGIVSGERIVAMDGRPMAGLSALRQRIVSAVPGDRLQLTVENQQKIKRDVWVELTPRPDDLRGFMQSPVGSRMAPLDWNIYANRDAMQKNPRARLLDFWATWCGPCRQTMPILLDLWNRYRSKGLEIIGVSSEAQAVLDAFQQREKLPWPLMRDPNETQMAYYGVRGLPTLILTDSMGYVQKVWTGVPRSAELEDHIRQILGDARK